MSNKPYTERDIKKMLSVLKKKELTIRKEDGYCHEFSRVTGQIEILEGILKRGVVVDVDGKPGGRSRETNDQRNATGIRCN